MHVSATRHKIVRGLLYLSRTLHTAHPHSNQVLHVEFDPPKSAEPDESKVIVPLSPADGSGRDRVGGARPGTTDRYQPSQQKQEAKSIPALLPPHPQLSRRKRTGVKANSNCPKSKDLGRAYPRDVAVHEADTVRPGRWAKHLHQSAISATRNNNRPLIDTAIAIALYLAHKMECLVFILLALTP